jgi:toxin-antitoxin system PIN domain toxin
VIVLDVNVLIAAHREDHPGHAAAAPWLENALSSPNGGVIVPDIVWTGFVRIVTNPRAFFDPSTLVEALDFLTRVCDAPAYRAVPGLSGGMEPFADVAREAGVTSRLVTDAYIAAVAMSYACPVATFDRDFRRFDGLEIVTPAA